jgi:hypothetical protein
MGFALLHPSRGLVADAHSLAMGFAPSRGCIKLAVRREFIISNGRPITIRQVLQRGYPRLRRFTAWHYLAARRALRIEATVIARCRYGRGRHHEMYRHGVIRLQAADLTGIIGSATPPKPGSGRFREDTLEGVGFVFAAIRDHRRRCRP